MAKVNIRESLNKIDLATDNKYDLLNTFDSKKLSDNSKKKLAEAIDNNSIASINRVLHESEEQLFKVVIQSGATKRDFESALYEDEAEGIVDYYGGRWIDENGFEWNMYVEEDDDSTEHAMVDNSYDMKDDERAQIECVESLTEGAHADFFDVLDRMPFSVYNDNNVQGDAFTGFYFNSEESANKFVNYLKARGFTVDQSEENNSYYKGYPFKVSVYDDIAGYYFDDDNYEYNESLTEASYGGAYDIEDDMFFTKEDIVEFADNICEYLGDVFGYQYSIDNIYMDGPRKLYINIFDNNYIEAESTFDIDMRKIRKPSDLFKFYGLDIENWFQKAFAREYRDAGLDESLTEDTVKQNGKWVNKGSEGTHGKFKTKKAADAQRKAMFANGYKAESLKEAFDDEIDLDYETDFDDDGVEEGNVFVEGGVEYAWIQREAGPLYLDFDKWAVWSAREYVDPSEFMTIHDNGKDYDFDGDAFKKKAMAAPIVYFVVEEDTGFIDWGPVESRIEAQDFLNGKQEDWDNNEYYGESLEKNLDEWYVHTIHYEDIGDGREYDYEVDHEEVLDYLSEIAIDEEDAPEDTEEYLKWVEDNFDELFNKYEYEIEEHFREDASQEEYDRRHSSYES